LAFFGKIDFHPVSGIDDDDGQFIGVTFRYFIPFFMGK
jgi:hypothetical protein